MNDFKYVSDHYNINKTIAYRLSIQLNPDGFSVLIADIHKNILFLLHRQSEDFAGNLSEFRENADLLPVMNLRFAMSVVLVNTPEITLVPDELYSEDLRDLYFSYNHPMKIYDQVMDCQVPLHKAVLLFKLDEKTISLIKLFHNSPSVMHSSVPYLEYIHSCCPCREGLFIHHTGMLLSVTAFRDQKLALHTIIRAADENDVVYHTLNTLTKTGMDRKNLGLYCSGTLGERSPAVRHLAGYVGTDHPPEK